PSRLAAPEPKSGASANSATRARETHHSQGMTGPQGRIVSGRSRAERCVAPRNLSACPHGAARRAGEPANEAACSEQARRVEGNPPLGTDQADASGGRVTSADV